MKRTKKTSKISISLCLDIITHHDKGLSDWEDSLALIRSGSSIPEKKSKHAIVQRIRSDSECGA